MKPAVIEAAINEGALRDHNARVPYSGAECAADGIECVEAGATLVHWHARDPATGQMRAGDTEEYSIAQRAFAEAKVLAYPTYPNQPVDNAAERMAHCFAMARDCRLELAPLDLGAAQQSHWIDGELRGSGTLANPLDFLVDAARSFTNIGLRINLSSFDLGSTRLAVRLAQVGVLPQPLLLKFYLSDSWMVGPEPTEAAIDLHVAQLPDDLDVDWLIVPFRLTSAAKVERLCRHAFAAGGGVRIGLGDNDALFPADSNADLVRRAVRWAIDGGRAVATADDLRNRWN